MRSGRAYEREVAELREWFKERLRGLPVLELTIAQRCAGVDGLPAGPHKELVREAGDAWGWSVSYRQLGEAFFGAAEAVEKLRMELTTKNTKDTKGEG